MSCGWHAFCGRPAGHDGDCEIRPQPGFQEDFLSLGVDGAIGGGAAGGGKSAALLLEALRWIEVPGYEALLLRKVKDDLFRAGGLWVKMHRLYPAFGGVPNEEELSWTFPSGAKIYAGYVDPKNYEQQWQGTEFAFLGFDELTHFTRSEVVYLLGRNRTSSGIRPYWRATCNPDPDSWVRGFVDWWIADADHAGAVIGRPELTAGPAGWPRADRANVTRYYVRRNNEEVWGDSPQELIDGLRCRPSSVRSFTFLPSSEIVPHLGDYEGTIDEQEDHLRLRLLGNWNARQPKGRPFSPEWVQTAGGAPLPELLIDDEPPGLDWLRVWDLAATAEQDAKTTGSETAGLKMALKGDLLIIADAKIDRGDSAQVEEWVTTAAHKDGRETRIWLCRERAGAGKAQLGYFQRALRGWDVDGEPETGAKLARLGPAIIVAKTKRLRLVRGPWNSRFLARLLGLPGPPDDVGDALAAGLDQLAQRKGRPTVQQAAEAFGDAVDAFARHAPPREEWPL